MKKVEYVLRQGDVYIYKISDFPDSEKVQDKLTKKKQVALGEISGHNHYFDGGAAVDLFKIKDFEGLTFMDVKKDSSLIHGVIKGFKGKEADQDYHWALDIPEGKYVTGIVEETDWLNKTIRRVVD